MSEQATLPNPEQLQENTRLEGLGLLEETVVRLENEAQSIEDNQLPEWVQDYMFTSGRELKDKIVNQDVNARDIAEYVTLSMRFGEIKDSVKDSSFQMDHFYLAADTVGAEKMALALEDEELGPALQAQIITRLRKVVDGENNNISQEVSILKSRYGVQSLSELYAVDDELGQQLVPLLAEHNVMRKLRYEEERANPIEEEQTYEQQKDHDRAWVADVLVKTTGMNAEDALGYAFAASRRIGNYEGHSKVIKNALHFGKDRLAHITRETFIQGIDAYSIEQLEQMERLAADPEEVAEKLRNHDVNVVFTNRSGDHNGIFGSVGEEFQEENGRTLFFEINRMSDIFRHMATLQAAGIKPSSMVLGAHSGEGQFFVVDERDPEAKTAEVATIAGQKLVAMANEEGMIDKKGRAMKGFSMHGMDGFGKLVGEYMQPSRGIDEPESEAGKKKIIFKACHVGTEVDMYDKDDAGESIHVGSESVVSQLGKDLTKFIPEDDTVEIYGAPGGMQSHRTEAGIRFSGSVVNYDEGRSHMKAVRVTVNGEKVSKDEVDEIIMRKVA